MQAAIDNPKLSVPTDLEDPETAFQFSEQQETHETTTKIYVFPSKFAYPEEAALFEHQLTLRHQFNAAALFYGREPIEITEHCLTFLPRPPGLEKC